MICIHDCHYNIILSHSTTIDVDDDADDVDTFCTKLRVASQASLLLFSLI